MRVLPSLLTIGCAIAVLVESSIGQQSGRYQYVFPKPNSRYVSRETNIILRPGKEIERFSVQATLIRVEGSQSGRHRGTMTLSDDERTVVFNLREPLFESERVSVDVAAGLRATDGTTIGGVSFRFATSISPSAPSPGQSDLQSPATDLQYDRADQRSFFAEGDSLPVDFPPIRVDTVNNTASGELFIGGFSGAGGTTAYANYLLILDNAGKPLAYKRIGTGVNPFEYMFKVEPNGFYSYIERTPSATSVKVVDTAFNLVDTYPKGNPATTSHADFLLLPNGHAIVLYFDIKTIDMGKIVKGGNPAATVWGNLIQEFDRNKNVVFQWSSFDYLPITDTYEDTLAASFDYSHANGVELDYDGNFMISNRHLSEITKIDRNTGEVIWRMGGKRNQFTFVNEHQENAPTYFSYMHNIKRSPNGNITILDNGNQHKPQYSRAVEYKLDEVNKTATMVWEYRHSPDIFTSAHGCVQRLPNGNTIIGWGDAGLQGKPAITEVHPDKSLAFELYLPVGYRCMRAYRMPWRPGTLAGSKTLSELLQGNTYSFNDTSRTGRTGVRIKFNTLTGTFYNTASVERLAAAPLNPRFFGRSPWMASQRVTVSQYGMATIDADVFFDVSQFPGLPDPNLATVFQRDTIGSGVFSALQTSYNSVKNEIFSNTSKFGEFIFCWNDTDTLASAPTLISPTDRDSVNQKLPLAFIWNPRGYVTGYQLQVSLDSSFKTLTLNDSLLASPTDTLKSVAGGTTYYWRVRARNYGQISSWSTVKRFTATLPYVAVASPSDHEAWQRGNEYFIKWTSNIKDRVRIYLYKGSNRQSIVKDSATNVGAFAWIIPSSLAPDTTYRIRITSVADSSVFSMSSGTFSVTSSSTGIENSDQVPGEYALDQNYPNPFNPKTVVRYQLARFSIVKLRIFDVLGREIETLVDGARAAGSYTVSWDASSRPSGVYIYQLQAIDPDGGTRLRYDETKRMVLLK